MGKRGKEGWPRAVRLIEDNKPATEGAAGEIVNLLLSEDVLKQINEDIRRSLIVRQILIGGSSGLGVNPQLKTLNLNRLCKVALQVEKEQREIHSTFGDAARAIFDPIRAQIREILERHKGEGGASKIGEITDKGELARHLSYVQGRGSTIRRGSILIGVAEGETGHVRFPGRAYRIGLEGVDRMVYTDDVQVKRGALLLVRVENIRKGGRSVPSCKILGELTGDMLDNLHESYAESRLLAPSRKARAEYLDTFDECQDKYRMPGRR